MLIDVKNKVRDTALPDDKPLLPLFEAVVNSIHATQDPSLPKGKGRIDIRVLREPILDGFDGEGKVTGFDVTDNGAGFEPLNLRSFFMAHSDHKASKGGKGVGRFIWLKAFHSVEIESHFKVDGKMVMRSFPFSVTRFQIPTEGPEPSERTTRQTIVRLRGLQTPYSETCQRRLSVIARHLIEHCIRFLLDNHCPRITLRDDVGEPVNINDLFLSDFQHQAATSELTVDGQRIIFTGFRLRGSGADQHRIMYAADGREVKTQNLAASVPNMRLRLSDAQGGFWYLAFVEGDYLNKNVTPERTGFSFPSDRLAGSIYVEGRPVLSDLRDAVVSQIDKELADIFQFLDNQKIQDFQAIVRSEAPECRVLQDEMPALAKEIPPGLIRAKFVRILHDRMYEKRLSVRREVEAFQQRADTIGLDPHEVAAQIGELVRKVGQIGQSDLAQYVVNRRVIIDFLQRSLALDANTGRYPLEKVIHEIIYPMHHDSSEVAYEDQNIWIIDEKLAFHSYLASDKQLRSMSPLHTASQARADIVIFDDSMIFTSDSTDAPMSSIVVVEFKRPNLKHYDDENPLEQAQRVIEEIRAGKKTRADGTRIAVRGEKIPAFAYVICDPCDELTRAIGLTSLRPTSDGLGWAGYLSNSDIYMEITPYSKLLEDARLRNRVLFKKLDLVQ